METKQLYEKVGNEFKPINPSVSLDELVDKESELTLGEILSKYNHLKVNWKGDVSTTRKEVPVKYRHQGLYITYNNGTDLITEYYVGDNNSITTETWIDDSNWQTPITEDWINANIKSLKPAKDSVGYENLTPSLRQMVNQNTNVTNFPDDEDLTSQDNLLKFKDREYDPDEFSGKGYVILRKNLKKINGVTKNILEQSMINKENTIYEIRYDFDLNNVEIKVPNGCTLKFEGGMLMNGIINFNNTLLSQTPKLYIIPKGTISNNFIYIDWFTQNEDISEIMNILGSLLDYKTICFSNKEYVFTDKIKIDNHINLVGDVNTIINLKRTNFQKIYESHVVFGYKDFYDGVIKNITFNIYNPNNYKCDVLHIGGCTKFHIINCVFNQYGAVNNGFIQRKNNIEISQLNEASCNFLFDSCVFNMDWSTSKLSYLFHCENIGLVNCSDITVKNCIVNDMIDDMGFHTCSNIKIYNNTMNANDGRLYFSNCKDVIIDSNKLIYYNKETNGMGIYFGPENNNLSDANNNCLIINNFIDYSKSKDISNYGMRLWGKNIQILNNILIGTPNQNLAGNIFIEDSYTDMNNEIIYSENIVIKNNISCSIFSNASHFVNIVDNIFKRNGYIKNGLANNNRYIDVSKSTDSLDYYYNKDYGQITYGNIFFDKDKIMFFGKKQIFDLLYLEKDYIFDETKQYYPGFSYQTSSSRKIQNGKRDFINLPSIFYSLTDPKILKGDIVYVNEKFYIANSSAQLSECRFAINDVIINTGQIKININDSEYIIYIDEYDINKIASQTIENAKKQVGISIIAKKLMKIYDLSVSYDNIVILIYWQSSVLNDKNHFIVSLSENMISNISNLSYYVQKQYKNATFVDFSCNPYNALVKGTTAQRPTNVNAGFLYKDTTLNKWCISNGDGTWEVVNGVVSEN